MASNPYTLTFGREPARLISRDAILAQIEESFAGDPPSQQVFLITGVRGSGKTVLMTELSKRLRRGGKWVVVELNPERDMLQALAAKLSSDNGLASIFQSPKINLSFFELGLEVSGAAPITDIEVALARMLEGIKKHGKKVLVTVDEVVSTQNMRVFASTFQILMRQDLPIFLVMTGLYDNIRSLQDEETLLRIPGSRILRLAAWHV
jgi:Cdc6-like AAA superfamily ATPase